MESDRKWCQVSLWGAEYVLELDSGDSCTIF